MQGFKLVAVVSALSMAAFTIAIGAARPWSPSSTAPAGSAPTTTQQRAVDDYAKLPVSFVENRGQVDASVRYYAQGDRYAFYLTPGAIVLELARQRAQDVEELASDPVSLALRFLGANPDAEPRGSQRAAGVINDLRGSDPARWQTNIPQFRDVVYADLWPNIDLRLREQSGVLKYEFHVRPGASPSDIGLAYSGAHGLAVGEDGGLQITTGLGTLTDSAPVSYQDIGGVRSAVRSHYVLAGRGQGDARFSIAVGTYRTDHELVIDPGVQYTTFLGGSAAETGEGIAVTSAGNAIVAGTTQSPDFPTTAGAFKRSGSAQNNSDVFVAKLNPAGTALVYSTFVGGSDLDFGHSLAIDTAGNAYVTGTTKSSNFPTSGGAFDKSLNIPPNCPRCSTDNTDGFVFKLNAAGSALAYSTYLGGTDIDSPRSIAVDGAGSAFVTGETLSTDFPTTTGAFGRTQHGDNDMFVTKLNTTGSALTYSTYLGGTLADNGQRIAVDAGGNAYAMGFSRSPDFPTTAGAFDKTLNGDFDVTLTKINPSGSTLVYSTYLGGSDFDSGSGLAVDSAGNAVVAGGTSSADWPTTPAAYDKTFDNGDAYVTKLNPAGSALVFSTFVGGSAVDSFSGIVLDATGNAWLTGNTSSTDYPVSAGAPDTTFNGGTTDATVAELDASGSSLPFATYLGGSQPEAGDDIARDPTGNVYLTGLTYSQDFPATVGAFDRVFNGDVSIFWGDAFVTKIDPSANSSTPASPPGVPGAPTLISPSNNSVQPQPITFDWSDVPQAASYTIQIDDSSAFSAPLVRDQSVASSIYATSDLATSTHFWRVRGVNSAGVAGAWSAVRSFTPQTAPPAATLSTLDVNPSSVTGGTTAAGTVVMSVAATNGALVSLTSSNPSAASVPATTTVAPNGFTGTFTVTTSAVTSSTPVTITASYNGTTRTAPLTVTPPPTGPSTQSATLTLTATGRNGETITSDPSGINVTTGSSGTATYPSGTPITLRVSNGRSVVWSGACTSGGSKTKTCTFTLNTNAAVTANVQ